MKQEEMHLLAWRRRSELGLQILLELRQLIQQRLMRRQGKISVAEKLPRLPFVRPAVLLVANGRCSGQGQNDRHQSTAIAGRNSTKPVRHTAVLRRRLIRWVEMGRGL